MHHTSVALALTVAAGLCSASLAQPGIPVYSIVVQDAVTGDNNFSFGGFRYYTVDPGADRYQIDLYERPLSQAFQPINGLYAAEEYFGFVDITQAKFGFDNRYLYAAIQVFSLDTRTKDGVNNFNGLEASYSVRFSTDPDGRNGFWLRAEKPQTSSFPNFIFAGKGTEGWQDTDADVGGRGGPIHGRGGPSGLNVTKTDNVLEEQGLNGFDAQVITSDGLLLNGGQIVAWQRVSPADPTVVEFAMDYLAVGLSRADLENLRYLQWDAVVGNPSDPGSSLWNDKYDAIEAGSPNPGVGTDNEFGTQGLGSISGADNVRASGLNPCPADFNGDGFVDFFDYDAFALAFETGC